jgi:hypothetical protein
MEFAKEDSRLQALATNNEYDEKFTLQCIREDVCVAKYEFNGKLKYDDKVNFYFAKHFIATKNSKLQIPLEFNHDVVRQYPYYYNHTNNPEFNLVNDVFTVVDVQYCCLSQILYKVV